MPAGVVQVATAGTNRYGDVSSDTTFGAGLIGTLLVLYFVATILPNISLGVRRLHDVSLRGWALLIGIVPFFGSIVLLAPSPCCRAFRPVGNSTGTDRKRRHQSEHR